jgi:DNA-binding Lrp family transcriptional regulator
MPNTALASRSYKVRDDQVISLIKEHMRVPHSDKYDIKTTKLGKMLGIKPSSATYRVKRLIDLGYLVPTGTRGSYNKELFRISSSWDKKIQKQSQELNTKELENKSQKQIEESKTENKKSTKTNKSADHSSKSTVIYPDQYTSIKDLIKKEMEEQISSQPIDIKPEKEKSIQPLVSKPLTLDDRIQQYLATMKRVPKADDLIQHNDKEVLSVMNQSLQEILVYIKDLAQQLSTSENRKLIQNLIEERNKNLNTIQDLQAQVDSLKEENLKIRQKYQLDPKRIRQMQQLIISIVDNYVSLSNVQLTMDRDKFRKMMFEQVGHLADYVLHVES